MYLFHLTLFRTWRWIAIWSRCFSWDSMEMMRSLSVKNKRKKSFPNNSSLKAWARKRRREVSSKKTITEWRKKNLQQSSNDYSPMPRPTITMKGETIQVLRFMEEWVLKQENNIRCNSLTLSQWTESRCMRRAPTKRSLFLKTRMKSTRRASRTRKSFKSKDTTSRHPHCNQEFH